MNLRELIEQEGGNGFVLTDRGNGKAGASWMYWDGVMDESYGHVGMKLVAADELIEARRYPGEDVATVGDIMRLTLDPQAWNEAAVWASDWIDDPDDSYGFRILF